MPRSGAPPDITPVLVTYNSAGILRWSSPGLSDCARVVVVDNNSSDDTASVVRELLPQATFISNSRNLGFARANNLGVSAVSTRYAFLHNPDARLAPGALWSLREAAERYPEAAVIAPVLYDAPGVVGDFFRGPFFEPSSHPPPVPEGDVCCDFVTGAAMLLDLEKLRQVGLFDPWFFLYFEDDDLCLRVRHAGHSIVVAHDAHIEHHVRQSSPASARTTWRRHYCMTLSKLYLTRKVFGFERCLAVGLRIALSSLVALPLMALTLQRERATRHAARAAAALLAWRHLTRPHCLEPTA